MAALGAVALAGFAGLAGLAGLAGCGDDSGDDGRPDDFAFKFQHVDGSVPPPYHAEWSVEVDADGSGTATYVPDYPGEEVPVYTVDLDLDDAQLDAIYEDLGDAGLLEEMDEASDPPVGGDVETAVIMADGETVTVPGFDESGSSPAAEVSEAVQALVPEDEWQSFEDQREEYAVETYGEKP